MYVRIHCRKFHEPSFLSEFHPAFYSLLMLHVFYLFSQLIKKFYGRYFNKFLTLLKSVLKYPRLFYLIACDL